MAYVLCELILSLYNGVGWRDRLLPQKLLGRSAKTPSTRFPFSELAGVKLRPPHFRPRHSGPPLNFGLVVK